ncbi:MAG: IS1595 family transposase [Gammaproteobacteria bacterium]|nr:IS1595 family transposase [Gammaproteobacteria bacterium]
MDRQTFSFMLDHLGDMSSGELKELENRARSLRGSRKGLEALKNFDQSMTEVRRCPHCGKDKAFRHGRDSRGAQRFRCRPVSQGGCGRIFNGRTGTPFARMRKPEKWSIFLEALAEGYRSLDDLHKYGKVDVSPRTLWRWRNVVFEALGSKKPVPLKGIVEIDETYFRESFKGSRGWKRGNPPVARDPRRRGEASGPGLSLEYLPVLTAIDRHGTRLKQVLGYQDEIREALQDGIEKGSVLCTDGLATYRSVARDAEAATHVVVPSSEPRNLISDNTMLNQSLEGHFSLARVNAMHTGMKSFVNRQARGVSSRYLQGYLSWIQAVRKPSLSECEVLSPSKTEDFNT